MRKNNKLKCIMWACPILVLSCVSLCAQQTCAPVPAGIVSWWRGESNFVDSVSTHDGIPSGSVSYVAGKVGKGLSIGIRNYLVVPESPELDLGHGAGLTIEG